MQAVLSDALHDLGTVRSRRLRETSGGDAGNVAGLEAVLVQMVLELMDLELQAGLNEQGTSRMQVCMLGRCHILYRAMPLCMRCYSCFCMWCDVM